MYNIDETCIGELIGKGAYGWIYRLKGIRGKVVKVFKDPVECKAAWENNRILMHLDSENILLFDDQFIAIPNALMMDEITPLSKSKLKGVHLIKVIGDIAEGIKILHENGIAHLDIRLDNVGYKVVDGRYVGVLFDFDLMQTDVCPCHFGHEMYHVYPTTYHYVAKRSGYCTKLSNNEYFRRTVSHVVEPCMRKISKDPSLGMTANVIDGTNIRSKSKTNFIDLYLIKDPHYKFDMAHWVDQRGIDGYSLALMISEIVKIVDTETSRMLYDIYKKFILDYFVIGFAVSEWGFGPSLDVYDCMYTDFDSSKFIMINNRRVMKMWAMESDIDHLVGSLNLV